MTQREMTQEEFERLVKSAFEARTQAENLLGWLEESEKAQDRHYARRPAIFDDITALRKWCEIRDGNIETHRQRLAEQETEQSAWERHQRRLAQEVPPGFSVRVKGFTVSRSEGEPLTIIVSPSVK